MIPRRLSERVLGGLRIARSVVLLGARQSGKSTLARSLVGPDFPAEIFTLDNAEMRRAASADPTGFVDSLPVPAVIDEVQLVPDLMRSFKERLDLDRRKGQFLLTGSADLAGLVPVHDALPGRAIYRELWPLAQAEIEGREEHFIDRLFSADLVMPKAEGRGKGLYAGRMVAGGYPEALGLSGRDRSDFLASYIEAMVEREVVDLAPVSRPGALRQIFAMLAAGTGQLANYAKLGAAAGVDQKTAHRYVDLLQRMFLIYELPPWHANIGQRHVKASKLFVRDSGLAAHLMGVDTAGIETDITGSRSGPIFESFAVMEIARLAGWCATETRLLHFRDRRGHEVDLILERDNGDLVGVEVKAASSASSDDFRALRMLRDRLGSRFKAGVVLYAGELSLPFGDRLAAVPLASLWTA